MYFSRFSLCFLKRRSTDYLVFQNQERKTFLPEANERVFLFNISPISKLGTNNKYWKWRAEWKNIFWKENGIENNWLSEVSLSDTSGHFSSQWFPAYISVHFVQRNCVLMLLENLFVCWSDKSVEKRTKKLPSRKVPSSNAGKESLSRNIFNHHKFS